MSRIIKSAAKGYLEESLDLVERVFTESKGEESGNENERRITRLL